MRPLTQADSNNIDASFKQLLIENQKWDAADDDDLFKFVLVMMKFIQLINVKLPTYWHFYIY